MYTHAKTSWFVSALLKFLTLIIFVELVIFFFLSKIIMKTSDEVFLEVSNQKLKKDEYISDNTFVQLLRSNLVKNARGFNVYQGTITYIDDEEVYDFFSNGRYAPTIAISYNNTPYTINFLKDTFKKKLKVFERKNGIEKEISFKDLKVGDQVIIESSYYFKLDETKNQIYHETISIKIVKI